VSLFAACTVFFVYKVATGWRTGETSARGLTQVFREKDPFFFWLVMTVHGVMAMTGVFAIVMISLGR
jgi:hypothetical protein